MFKIDSAGFNKEIDRYEVFATLCTGDRIRVRVNAFEPQNQIVDHQSNLPAADIAQIADEITKEVFRTIINPGAKIQREG